MFTLSSCAERMVISEFYNNGEIYDLTIGMTEAEVINTLGVQPYEIQYNFQDESKVLMWNYRRPYHQVEREIKTTEAAINIQDPKWDDEEILHVHIENGKLSNYYTKFNKINDRKFREIVNLILDLIFFVKCYINFNSYFLLKQFIGQKCNFFMAPLVCAHKIAFNHIQRWDYPCL